MKREDCWMTFTEALEQYLAAREDQTTAPEGCWRWQCNNEDMKEASKHMEALTGNESIN